MAATVESRCVPTLLLSLSPRDQIDSRADDATLNRGKDVWNRAVDGHLTLV